MNNTEIRLCIFIGWFLMVMGVAVFTANILHLTPTNPDYDASWYKALIALGFSIFGTKLYYNNLKKS